MDLPSGIATPEIFLNGEAQTKAMNKGNGKEIDSTGSRPKSKSKWRKFRLAELLVKFVLKINFALIVSKMVNGRGVRLAQ